MSIDPFHYDCLVKFKQLLFNAELLTENRIKKQIYIKETMKEGIESVNSVYDFYYILAGEKEGKNYILHSSKVKELPILPMEVDKVAVGTETYYEIKEYDKVNIKPENQMTFRKLVDEFCDFKHTEPNDFLIYKIVMLAAWIDKLYIRISSKKEFGKDSIPTALNIINGYVNEVSCPTRAKAEYEIIGSKLLVINELADLEKKEKAGMQRFFLATAAGKPSYTKQTRSKVKAGEVVDITELSEVVIYNNINYYREKGQEYFEKLFTEAVTGRFFPIMFKGTLKLSQFRDRKDITKVAKKYMETNKAIMKTMLWLTQSSQEHSRNYHSLLKNYTRTIVTDDRHGNTVDILLNFIDLYSETQEEFTIMEQHLYSLYRDYMKQLKDPDETVLMKEEERVC